MFVKFIAKEDSWFIAGTEVYWEDNNWIGRRPTLEEYEQIKTDGVAVFRGINKQTMEEDGELCPLEEFEIEIIK